MKAEEIIELGTKLGLPFNRKDNYKDALAKDRVVFNGANAQRFLFEGHWTDDDIYQKMGESLRAMGNMQHRVEMHRLIQPF